MTCIRKYPLKLFEEKTTYNSAYKDHKQPRGKVYNGPFDHPPFDDRRKTKPYVPKDTHTMRPWKSMVPFDATLISKLIIRSHPQQTFNFNVKIEDTGREESIKTRHRVYMLPAVSMDDITDPNMRKLLVDNMYTSDWKKISAEVKHTCTKREIPNSTYEDPYNKTLRYKYDLHQHWPIDWKDKCKAWEEKYPKNVVNQTEMYWKKFKHPIEGTPAGQDPLKKFVTDETSKEIRDLIKKDELRLAYDKPKQYYTGYKPRYDIGPLRKQNIRKNPYEPLIKDLKYCKYN